MNAQVRREPAVLKRADLPSDPGVYAWYRRGKAIYIRKADSLRIRLGCHLSRGASLTNSAFRRNVAQHLDIASARAIYLGDYVPTEDDLEQIRRLIESCRLAWLTTKMKRAASALEDDFKAEWMRPLTKM
jgi:hypothetical protein